MITITKSLAAVSAALGLAASAATGELQWWHAPGFFLCGLLVVQIFEIITCMVRSEREGRAFKWRHAAFEKFVIWMMWGCTLFMDGAIKLAPHLFGELVRLPLVASPFFLPFSITFTFIATVAEMRSFARNARAVIGKDPVVDMFLKITGIIQKANHDRWVQAGHTGEPPGGRWMDGVLTRERIFQLRDYVDGKTPAPDWLVAVFPDPSALPDPASADFTAYLPPDPATKENAT